MYCIRVKEQQNHKILFLEEWNIYYNMLQSEGKTNSKFTLKITIYIVFEGVAVKTQIRNINSQKRSKIYQR